MAFAPFSDFAILISGSMDDSTSELGARREQVAKWLASTSQIIFPTREYGRLIYEFDMTGAREAIQTVCPSLF